jgi:hypothetical protein
VGLAVGLDRVHGLHRLRVGLDHLVRRVLLLKDFHALVPLMHVVRVLPQANAADKDRKVIIIIIIYYYYGR